MILAEKELRWDDYGIVRKTKQPIVLTLRRIRTPGHDDWFGVAESGGRSIAIRVGGGVAANPPGSVLDYLTGDLVKRLGEEVRMGSA